MTNTHKLAIVAVYLHYHFYSCFYEIPLITEFLSWFFNYSGFTGFGSLGFKKLSSSALDSSLS